jgi:hypothetical protein
LDRSELISRGSTIMRRHLTTTWRHADAGAGRRHGHEQRCQHPG